MVCWCSMNVGAPGVTNTNQFTMNLRSSRKKLDPLKGFDLHNSLARPTALLEFPSVTVWQMGSGVTRPALNPSLKGGESRHGWLGNHFTEFFHSWDKSFNWPINLWPFDVNPGQEGQNKMHRRKSISVNLIGEVGWWARGETRQFIISFLAWLHHGWSSWLKERMLEATAYCTYLSRPCCRRGTRHSASK